MPSLTAKQLRAMSFTDVREFFRVTVPDGAPESQRLETLEDLLAQARALMPAELCERFEDITDRVREQLDAMYAARARRERKR